MRIEIKVFNTTTGEAIFMASSPDIDSAIAELGTIERGMRSAHCMKCGEPTTEVDYCCGECAIAYNILSNEDSHDQFKY
jgi:hypothetical protein